MPEVLRPTRLPSNPFAAQKDTFDAYESVVEYEKNSELANNAASLVCARTIGYMLIEASRQSALALAHMTNEIVSCEHDGEKMTILGKQYIERFVGRCECMYCTAQLS